MIAQRKFLWIRNGGILLLVIMACYGAWGIWYADTAERNLIAGRAMLRVLGKYVREHHKWPGAESDLLDGSVVVSSPFAKWPDDAGMILQRVRVVYGVPLKEVAQSSSDSFPYVVTGRPLFFAPFQYDVDRLLDVVRNDLESDHGGDAPMSGESPQ